MSVMTITKLELRSLDLASRAEVAVSTSKPWISRRAFRVSRIAGSSSTKSMRRFIWMRVPSLYAINVSQVRQECRFAVKNFRHWHRYSPSRDWYTGEVTGYHVENFGCRTSQADGDAIAARLEALGASPADGLPQTDVVVVNTCSVTAEADRDARAYIRRVQRANPLSRIVVTGCYAQRAPEEIAALPGVSAVVGNSHKNHVASIAMAGSTSAAAKQS